MHAVFVAVYAASAVVLALHGLHMAYLSLRALRAAPPSFPPVPDDDLPPITVQLPLFNEAAVVERLLAAVAAFDYPRFDVQVLDDSTDETTALVADAVARLRAEGLAVEHLRRDTRDGFKAGALAHGLERSDAPLVAVFDADFVPSPDLLRRLAAPLVADERLAFAQARWTHRNAGSSGLTRVQAAALDAHFATEQHGRWATGLVFTFNGTAGLWRRSALDAAGGWRGDTLTEDLDLSVRTYLGGGRGVFLDDVTAPADLPADVHALRAQQRRWARGNAEVARLLLVPMLRSSLPGRVKVFAALHLLAPTAFVAAFGLLLAYAPAALTGGLPRWAQAVAMMGVAGAMVQHTVALRRRDGRWLLGPLRTLGVAAGMTALVPACAVAVAEAFGPRRGVFERTAKSAARRRYRTPRPARIVALETATLAYVAVGFGAMLVAGAWSWLPFQALLVASLGALAVGNVRSEEKPASPVFPSQGDRTLPILRLASSRRRTLVGDLPPS